MENSDDRATSDRILKEGDMSYDRPRLYYVHEKKRIITDLTESQQLLETSDYLLDRARQLGLPFHSDAELVITEVPGPNGRKDFGYYFVDHQQRLLFWVHDYDLSEIFFNVKGVTARDHMKQAVITQYWMHIGLYPNRRELKADDYEELRNILIGAIADAATSQTPLAPFDLDSMVRMLDLVEKLEGSIGKKNPYGVWVIARFATEFSSSRFINFSGQPFARLDAGKRHLEELKQMWVDQIVHYPSWQKYIAKLTSDWARFTIFSTVLLTTDVGLLAAPTLGGGGGFMTAAMASVYLSIFFSVASILTSIQLTNRVSGKEYSSATSTSALLTRTSKSVFGTDSLAIMYSLPYAFLVWGIFLFVLGISLLVFSSTNRAMLASLAPLYFLLFVCSIWPSISGRGAFEMFEKSWWRRSLIRGKSVHAAEV
ncbi:hypothetical protein EDD15DRAFT_2195833 [Pisolithus albus]|nr:hypothetical protein EDD15DRAFT_2195833 [Pisolithus albus]